jgi:regulator of protease activity HflC (stomatin/prohibitin superfamily)
VNAVVRIRDYQHGVLRILQTTLRMTLARQVEAERKRRAMVIAAEGEFQAAGRLSQAMGVISREPGALTCTGSS